MKKLELGNILIHDVQFSNEGSKVENGVLYVNKEEICKIALEDENIASCEVFLARPGESVRITPVKDVIAHVISGAIFFGIWGEWFFTQEGFFAWGQTLVDMFPGQSLYVIYSLIYNLSFLLPEVVITAVVGFLITKAMPRLLDKKDMQQ